MDTTSLNQKIINNFGELSIDKRLIRRLGIAGDDRQIPSFVLDWIVTHLAKREKSTTNLQRSISNFIKEHLPSKNEKDKVKFKLKKGEILTLLDIISVRVNLKDTTMTI